MNRKRRNRRSARISGIGSRRSDHVGKIKKYLLSLPGLLRPLGMTCPDPNCGGTMTPYGDRYKCGKCGGLV
jgi:ribosomal protein S27AE